MMNDTAWDIYVPPLAGEGRNPSPCYLTNRRSYIFVFLRRVFWELRVVSVMLAFST